MSKQIYAHERLLWLRGQFTENGRTYYRYEALVRIHGIHVGKTFRTRTLIRVITTDENHTEGSAFIEGSIRPIRYVGEFAGKWDPVWETVSNTDQK